MFSGVICCSGGLYAVQGVICCSGGLYGCSGELYTVQGGYMLFRGVICCSGGLYGCSVGLYAVQGSYMMKKEKTGDYSGHYVIASSRPPERQPLERHTLVPK